MDTIILGGGIAGLSAGYTLEKNNVRCTIFDKNSHYGGLCRSFKLNGFTFDTFAHVAFSKDPYVTSLLEEKTPYLIHKPEAMNYYHGKWVRNPAQNNLVDLDVDERIQIIKGFVERKAAKIENYEDWLMSQYGNYFTENFPACYTKKYWTVEPRELEIKWVKNRMYVPSLEEILRGAMTHGTPNVHYTKEIHYPCSGGYEAFLKPLAESLDIRLNKEVYKIDTVQQVVHFTDGNSVSYDNLISTLPLDGMVSYLENAPQEIIAAAEKLDYTSGVMVSIGLKCENISPALWFYIYDEDIYPARVYAPNIKSPANVPEGCCAIQAEIYFSKRNPRLVELERLKEETICQLTKMGLFENKDIIIEDVREEKYANVMFTPEIYTNRDKIRKYLFTKNIICAGRFGEWDYLWTDQSLLSGRDAAEKVIKRRKK